MTPIYTNTVLPQYSLPPHILWPSPINNYGLTPLTLLHILITGLTILITVAFLKINIYAHTNFPPFVFQKNGLHIPMSIIVTLYYIQRINYDTCFKKNHQRFFF